MNVTLWARIAAFSASLWLYFVIVELYFQLLESLAQCKNHSLGKKKTCTIIQYVENFWQQDSENMYPLEIPPCWKLINKTIGVDGVLPCDHVKISKYHLVPSDKIFARSLVHGLTRMTFASDENCVLHILGQDLLKIENRSGNPNCTVAR